MKTPDIITIIILCFPLYFLLELLIRKCSYPSELQQGAVLLWKWKRKKEWMIFISPGYYLARYYKNKTAYFHPLDRAKARAKIIEANNVYNWLVSATLFIASSVIWQFPKNEFLISCLSGILFWRYISRSFEISYAFGIDAVLKEESKSGLDKHSRIRLALVSYVEIYLYSASFYLAFFPSENGLSALMMSLNVGTLTNVGYAFSDASKISDVTILVFVQVIATLSLVVLSLASYVSRSDGKHPLSE